MRDKGLAFDDGAEGSAAPGLRRSRSDLRYRGRRCRAQGDADARRIAFGIPVQFDKAYVEGITKLEAADIKYAEQLGYRIKLLGIAKRREKGIELRVHPTLMPAKRLIANVEGAMNAVHGARAMPWARRCTTARAPAAEPTASAVMADLVDITRLAHRRPRPPRAAPGLPAGCACPTCRSCR